MNLLCLGLWLVSVLLFCFVFKTHRNAMRRMKLKLAAWDRQRWSIQMFNGRCKLGFGYYLHRSPS